jgi:hypothetical protein
MGDQTRRQSPIFYGLSERFSDLYANNSITFPSELYYGFLGKKGRNGRVNVALLPMSVHIYNAMQNVNIASLYFRDEPEHTDVVPH